MHRRLGRLANRPDLRDWSRDKLHEKLDAAMPTPAELEEPLGQAIADLPYFGSWEQYRLFWRSVKDIRHKKPQPQPQPVPDARVWTDTVVLDQGDFGTCVGNGGAGFLACDPVNDPGINETFARALYYDCTVEDGAPDPSYQNGSSIRSLGEVLRNRQRILGYAFAKTLDDVDEWLLNHGPVVIGIDWTNDMFDPDKDGTLHPTGKVAGGHCVLLNGKAQNAKYMGVNSWGPDWGVNGHFLIAPQDLAVLLEGIQTPGDFLLAAELPL